MKLKIIILLGILFTVARVGSAQTTIETFAGTDEMVIEAWFYHGITEDYKFNIFSLNDVTYNYETEQNAFLSYTVLGYDVWKGLGPVVGARLNEGRTSALVGIQYGKGGKRFFITTNITSELREAPFFEWYLLTQYRFPINDKLGFFSQLQNSTNFDSDAHAISLQRLRLGVSIDKFQVGFGINTYQFGNEWNFDNNPGGFLRLEF